jgi:hypothetical protein
MQMPFLEKIKDILKFINHKKSAAASQHSRKPRFLDKNHTIYLPIHQETSGNVSIEENRGQDFYRKGVFGLILILLIILTGRG